MLSWLKTIPIKRYSQSGKRTPPWRLLPRETQDVHRLKRVFGNLHGISWVCTHFVGNNKTNNCSDRQQILHTFFPNEGNSASTLECLCLCVANWLQHSTQCWFSQHCGWFSFHTGTRSHGEETSQKLVRYTNNTYRSDHIFLGCYWRRTIFLHTSRQKG